MRGFILRYSFLATLSLTAIGPLVYCVEPATQPSPELIDAIDRLGDADSQVRHEAEKVLWLAGRSAEPLLRAAATGNDPEIALRARQILSNFALGIYPDTPPRVIELVTKYRDANQENRRQIIAELQRIDQQNQRIVGRLWLAEKDPAARNFVFGPNLAFHIIAWAQQRIADGDESAARELIRIAALSAIESQARNAAAYFLLSGTLDAESNDAEKRLAAGDEKGPATFLLYAYRAKGDLDGAWKIASKYATPQVQANLAQERGDWSGAAAAYAKVPKYSTPLPNSGRLAAYYRLAGDEARCWQTIHAIPAESLDVYSALKLYFLNGRPDEGLKFLAHMTPPHTGTDYAVTVRVELLCKQWRFREAAELANRDKSGDPAALLPLAMGLYDFGAKDQALAILDQVYRKAKAEKNADVFARLIYIHKALGLSARTRELVLEHLALFGEEPAALGPLVQILPFSVGDARRWWAIERKLNPAESVEAALSRLETFFAGKMSRQDAQSLIDLAVKESSNLLGSARSYAVSEIVRLAAMHDVDDAHLDRYADLAPTSQVWMTVGDMLGGKGEWKRAAAAYGNAWDQERTGRAENPLSIMVQGHALEKADQAQEGRKLIERGHKMLLGGDPSRNNLIYGLTHHDMEAEAQRQRDLAVRTGAFDDYDLGQSLKSRAEKIYKTDPLTSADLFERWLFIVYQSGSFFSSDDSYIIVPHMIHKWKAQGFSMKGDLSASVREWQACLAYLPYETDDASEAYLLLKKLDRAKEADELYSRTRDGLTALCDNYPACPTAHNNLAWLAGRCRRDLDPALTHARKAVDLDPKNAAYLDTLAEVQFARGDKQAAIATMHKCIELAPDSVLLQERLKKMETSE